MSQPLLNEIAADQPPHTIDVIRDILLDAGNLPRLMEVYYLAREPGLLEILRGLSTLPDGDRKLLQQYIVRESERPLRVRELPTGAIILELQEEPRRQERA